MVEKKTKTVKVGGKIRASAVEPVGEPETEIPTEVTNLVDELVNALKKVDDLEPTPEKSNQGVT